MNVNIICKDDTQRDGFWDGKVKNLVYDIDSMCWIAHTATAANGAGPGAGGGGDASAANQATEIAKLASIDGKLPTALDVDGGVKAHVQNFPVTQAVSGSVSVSNLPATQAVSIASMPSTPVTGTFWQGTQPVSGPLTDTQLRATAVPVSGTVAVTGALTDTQIRATALPVSIASMPSTAVTGPLTDTQLRAAAVPVSGTVAVTGPLTDTQLRATAVPVSGVLTDTQLRATAVPVSIASMPSTPVTGTFWQATQPVSIATAPVLVTGSAVIGRVGIDQTTPGTTNLVQLATPAAAASNPIGAVSLGNSLGKANAMKTGSLATTAVTADQVVLTYTVTAGKTLYLEYVSFDCRLTTFATTATWFGAVSLENPSGTKIITVDISGGGVGYRDFNFAEPIPIAAGTVIRAVTTPGATTSYTWKCNFGGYEK